MQGIHSFGKTKKAEAGKPDSLFEEFGCPTCDRSDKGGKKVEVGSNDICSSLMGRSTHNQRIERLWTNFKKEVTSCSVEIMV